MSKYLEFIEVPYKGKTKRFEVISKSSGYRLGKIAWYSQWRQYTFSPSFETIWNRDCLKDIIFFITNLMQDRKEQHDRDNFKGIYSTDGIDK